MLAEISHILAAIHFYMIQAMVRKYFCIKQSVYLEFHFLFCYNNIFFAKDANCIAAIVLIFY